MKWSGGYIIYDMITYKPHPIDGNFNYIGIDNNKNIIFDGYLVGDRISFVDVYSSKGKWLGKKIACFNPIIYKK
jgi:hypothetical protein